MRMWRISNRGLLATTVVVLAAAGGFSFILTGLGDPTGPSLQGVPAEDLKDAGIELCYASAGDTPLVSSDTAEAKAIELNRNSRVIEKVLVLLLDKSSETKAEHMAWAINLDPMTVQGIPPLGPPGSQDPNLDYRAEYAVAFMDATTGDLIFMLQRGGVPVPK